MNETKKRILYLSLTGMSEPLGKSQVLEYLYDIVNFYDVEILSCEKPKTFKLEPELGKKISGFGICWHHISYSNRFGLISVVLQFLRFFVTAVFCTLKRKPEIIHARSLIPAGVAVFVKFIFRVKVLFDIRGFFIDEKVDSGQIKKNSPLYRILKLFERFVYSRSDHIVTLTKRGKEIVIKEFNIKEESVTVIPTCVNTKLFKPVGKEINKVALRKELDLPNNKIIVHHGEVRGWYDFESEVLLFKTIWNQDREIVFLILNKFQHAYIKDVLQKHDIEKESYLLRNVDFNQIPFYLNACDCSLFFIKPTYSKQASHPTKFAENVACRLFSISNYGVGDMDYYVTTYKTAYLVDLAKLHSSLNKTAAEVLAIINNPTQQTLNIAYEKLTQECFSNEIAVERYLSIYKKLIL